MHRTLVEEGQDSATGFLRETGVADSEEADSVRGAIVQLAIQDFQAGERGLATELLEATKPVFSKSTQILSVLGQFYWYENDREGCVENFGAVLAVDPEHKLAKRFWDVLFFVPEEFEVPTQLVTDHLRVRPIRATDVDLDYKAVMDNRDHLRGVFGPDDDWPRDDLTREDDLRALANHEGEHEQRSAFTYTVMNLEGSEVLGCVYLLPVHHEDYDAQVFYWVTADASENGWEDELGSALREWIATAWPFDAVIFPGRDMDWETYERIQAEGYGGD